MPKISLNIMIFIIKRLTFTLRKNNQFNFEIFLHLKIKVNLK